MNCVGALLGGDAGLDFLAQIVTVSSGKVPSIANGLSPLTEQSDEFPLYFVPIVIAGPIGVQIGWIDGIDIANYQIVDVTLGASLGAGLGGFNRCYVDE